MVQRGVYRIQQLVGVIAHQPDARLAGVHHLLDSVPQRRQPLLMMAALSQMLVRKGRDTAQHLMQETLAVRHHHPLSHQSRQPLV